MIVAAKFKQYQNEERGRLGFSSRDLLRKESGYTVQGAEDRQLPDLVT